MKEWGNWQQQRHEHGWQEEGIFGGLGTPEAACATEKEDLALSAITIRNQFEKKVELKEESEKKEDGDLKKRGGLATEDTVISMDFGENLSNFRVMTLTERVFGGD